MSEGTISIIKDREKPIRNQHPWIFSGAIAKAQNAENGDIVSVFDHKGIFLGRGYWNAKSQIQVRIMTWHDEPINEAWWRKAIQRAMSQRAHYLTWANDAPLAFRLINAENDFIPGLVVDFYAGWLVLQAQTLHIDLNKHMIAKLLLELTKARGIYERSDIDVRGKEGLRESVGQLAGLDVPAEIEIMESGNRFVVDVRKGHKSGFYLDQRHNRQRLYNLITEEMSADSPKILNLFSYTGGFGVSALASGQTGKIVNVDSSRDALELAKRNFALNVSKDSSDTQPNIEFVETDCFDYLRECVQNHTQFDVIVCDPPKFAQNASHIDKAARGYKDLNLNAFKSLKSGGYLMTFSCSGAISRDLFQKIVFGALADSGRQAHILQQLGAGEDHPIALTFPEGEYLKGLLLRVY
jgi:23S rRNA (cytosine1962-C5)-methyltransferase